MITFPLNLKPAPRPVHEPAAWFISGRDAATWLDEVALWGLAPSALRFYVLPTSSRDLAASGVLVVPSPGQQPRETARALAYGRLGERLYLPADGMLDPPVSAEELRALLHLDVHVLHPATGLVGFEAREALRAHDLLAPPPERAAAAWNRARAAPERPWRLRSVEPTEQPSVDGILEAGRDDIGSEPPDALPPTEDESKLRDLARRAAAQPLRLIQRLTGGKRPPPLPGAAGASGRGGGIGGALNAWASQALAGLSKSLLDARARELERLRRMLESDTDQALRHAIPLRGLDHTRGRATPGDRLVPHGTNFDLRGLRDGSRPGDGWDIPPDLQATLRKQYREAANRELRLGRYRRAAYVFAELLGDIAAAASALEQGRHFREAAALYREQLKDARKAAECLERGGLLAEAATVYEALLMWEKAGDAYARIEHDADARRCYRQESARLITGGDLLGGARVLDAKLHAVDEALDVLDATWPHAPLAVPCLRESFRLRGRLARHVDAAAALRRVRNQRTAGPHLVGLPDTLAEVATTYPEPTIRTAAADLTRVVAGWGAAGAAGAGELSSLCLPVAKLVPEDRLLARDVERFLRRGAGASKPAKRPRHPDALPVVVRRFRLPSADWRTVAPDEHGFVAAGLISGGLLLLRGRWDGRLQTAFAATPEPLPPAAQVSLHRTAPGQFAMLSPQPCVVKGGRVTLPSTDVFPVELQVDFDRFPPATLCADVDEHGQIWSLRFSKSMEMTLDVRRGATFELIRSHTVNVPETAAGGPWQMVARTAHAYITWGNAVMHFEARGAAFKVTPTPGQARRLAVSAPHTRLRVAAALDEGGVLLWNNRDPGPFGAGLFDAALAFTRGGALVVVDPPNGRILRTDGNAVRHAANLAVDQKPVLGVTAMNDLNGHAIFYRDCTVVLSELPS